jgi:hypothetical protein
MQPTLLILAAGMGSRYGGLKQMDPMGPNGETVLDYSVFDAMRAGFGRVVFIIRRDFEDAFRQGIGHRFAGIIDVDYAFQALTDLPGGFAPPAGREKPWGTTHAVWCARNLVHGPFAVINADDFYGRDAYLRMADYFSHSDPSIPGRYAMIGYPLENTLSEHGSVNRGICQTNPAGLLEGVEEIIDITRDDDGVVRGSNEAGQRVVVPAGSPVSMNFWGFTPDFFPAAEQGLVEFLARRGHEMKSEFYIPAAVDSMIHSGAAVCTVIPTTANWFGVTYPQDKPHVVASIADLVAAGEYPLRLGSA